MIHDKASPKEQVRALLKSLETRDPRPIAAIDPDKYIQHNLRTADGLVGITEMMRRLPPGSARASVMRVFQDGDLVFAHTDYNFFGPKVGFDIFRFENGKMVEHWDNLQDKPPNANPSAHTMVDGPAEVRDLDKTEANKRLVEGFVENVLVRGRVEELPRFCSSQKYTQHNPQIGDGLSGLGEGLASLESRGNKLSYQRVHRVLGEGNFVLTVSEGRRGKEHVAFYDLFRVEDGKIVEHWDTIEAIPPRAEWQNQNGKF